MTDAVKITNPRWLAQLDELCQHCAPGIIDLDPPHWKHRAKVFKRNGEWYMLKQSRLNSETKE